MHFFLKQLDEIIQAKNPTYRQSRGRSKNETIFLSVLLWTRTLGEIDPPEDASLAIDAKLFFYLMRPKVLYLDVKDKSGLRMRQLRDIKAVL